MQPDGTTPGPWKVSQRAYLPGTSLPAGWRIDSADGQSWIAKTTPLVPLDSPAADTLADARLIAAAPSLYTALDEAVRVLDKITGAQMPRGRMWEIVGEVLKVSRAALRKADGDE